LPLKNSRTTRNPRSYKYCVGNPSILNYKKERRENINKYKPPTTVKTAKIPGGFLTVICGCMSLL